METLETKMGMLITIDGADRSGKHTQAVLLHERLKREGYNAHILDFPQYETLSGALIKEYLSEKYGSKEQLGAKIPSVLYALNRFERKDLLWRWKTKGEIGVLDRYIESNRVYQSAKLPPKEREAFQQFLDELEHDIFGLPQSDVVLYLHVPHAFAQRLAQTEEKETGKKLDIHEKDSAFQKKIIETYLELSEKYCWHVVECVRGKRLLTKEEIAKKVWNVVKPFLSKP